MSDQRHDFSALYRLLVAEKLPTFKLGGLVGELLTAVARNIIIRFFKGKELQKRYKLSS
jgi:hypothetical protein